MAAGHGEGRARRRQPLAERSGHGTGSTAGPERRRGAAAAGSIARSAARTPHTAGTSSAAAGHGREVTGSALPFSMGSDADWLSACSSCVSHWFLSGGGRDRQPDRGCDWLLRSVGWERRFASEGGRVVWGLDLAPGRRPRCRSLIGALGTGPAPERGPAPAAPWALPVVPRCPGWGHSGRGHSMGFGHEQKRPARKAPRTATEPQSVRLALRLERDPGCASTSRTARQGGEATKLEWE